MLASSYVPPDQPSCFLHLQSAQHQAFLKIVDACRSLDANHCWTWASLTVPRGAVFQPRQVSLRIPRWLWNTGCRPLVPAGLNEGSWVWVSHSAWNTRSGVLNLNVITLLHADLKDGFWERVGFWVQIPHPCRPHQGFLNDCRSLGVNSKSL